ncbi:MAG: transporter substrate-binding domain-containing protein [Terrimicrobiaceae bacterium]|nr:transporter substrate-binding domain-containing protein [Terrimicrobiaceae bacterium]
MFTLRRPFPIVLQLLFGCAWAALLVSASAAPEPAPQPQKLRVITRDLEPFSFVQDERRTGFAMDLWDDVAREIGVPYDVTVADTAQKMVDAVENKTADIAVGALSITAEREKVIEFSQPFYESGLQILVSKSGGLTDTVRSLLGNLLNWQVLGGFALALGIMVVISHLVWMHEHPVNEAMWPRSYLAGMWESFWWTISMFLVGGADNKGPIGVGGRIVAIVWMMISIVSISLLTASFSATLTVNSLNGDINGPEDLPNKEVATIKGSAAETWLQKHGSIVDAFPDVPACVAALNAGKVKAVVFDAPILKYAMTKPGNASLALVGNLFDRNNYGFALQQDSKLRAGVNEALLSLSERGVTEELRKKWFGAEK